ncbi:MAG: twin-arginine translocase TatA/TatE family subunit [Granulosicoccus sp.]
MGMPSVPQLLIILVIVVLIFGAKRLKNLGGDLGSAVKGFKQAVKEEDKPSAELEDGSSETADAVMNKTEDQKSS